VQDVNWVALTVFVLLFGLITWLGFAAARWRRGDLDLLHEWGLGGRRFGTMVTWFLVGGDLYTAYTFIAVPALMFGAGAIAFFAVPYTIVIYPFLFLVFPAPVARVPQARLRHLGDFVRGRFGNRWLALAIAVTGMVATMPYIALQLVGMQVVIGALGISRHRARSADLPLIIAFAVLAAFTYSSGCAPRRSIAIVKDMLIYMTADRRDHRHSDRAGRLRQDLRRRAVAQKLLLAVPGPHGPPGPTVPMPPWHWARPGAVLVSALADRNAQRQQRAHAIRRNAAMLPGYSMVLGPAGPAWLLCDRRRRRKTCPSTRLASSSTATTLRSRRCCCTAFPSWFVGVPFAAIGIGALVPAAIMSIAAANLFTRNIHREFINTNPAPMPARIADGRQDGFR
jgi:SSS family solute:Na+ symporter